LVSDWFVNAYSYKRFCKMMDLGVPLQAVKNKMMVEAPDLDPDLLE
jgi:hypothetical protein